jgi:hypothetical protein
VDTFDSTTVHNWIETATIQTWDGLVLNEFGAANDSLVQDDQFEYEDWVELYNAGTDTLLLDGACLTDDFGEPDQHVLSGDLRLPPGEHLVLWADGDTEAGPLHLDFRLDENGEELGLYRPDAATVIDTVTFAAQLTDKSTARYPDGAGPWSYSFHPTPGAANVEPEPQRFLVLNELMVDNVTTVPDGQSEYEPWLEIHNRLPIAFSLDGLTLTDDELAPTLWALPNSQVAGLGYFLLWADGEPGEGSLHTNFVLNGSGGFLGLYDSDGVTALDSLSYPTAGPDTAHARIPNGTGAWASASYPTPGAFNQELPPVLYLNEFMADNETTIQDEAGDYDDWLEIFNPGPAPAALGGLYLTDDLDDTDEWEFPDTTLAAGGFLIVWCDEDGGDGPLHASFKLSAGGEEIGLFGSEIQGNVLIDSRVYGPQIADISEGRETDGNLPWVLLNPPTPGYQNNPLTDVIPQASTIVTLELLPTRPNPFRTHTSVLFATPVAGEAAVAIYDVAGRRIRTLLGERVEPGVHTLRWDGRDQKGRAVASGVYFVRLRVAGEHDTRRLVRLR